MYQSWWRLFETADENMPGRVWWKYSGLELSQPVLEALYRGNARKLLNWQQPASAALPGGSARARQ
jgi:uncharacterized protein